MLTAGSGNEVVVLADGEGLVLVLADGLDEGEHDGLLTLPLTGSTSWRYFRSASVRLPAEIPCLTRSCATLVRSVSRVLSVWSRRDRCSPAIWPGMPW